MNDRQRDARDDIVFNAIVQYKLEHNGVAPTVRDLLQLCDLSGVSSTSHIATILDRLERDKRIVRAPAGTSRNIQIPGSAWIPPGHAASALANFAMLWDAYAAGADNPEGMEPPRCEMCEDEDDPASWDDQYMEYQSDMDAMSQRVSKLNKIGWKHCEQCNTLIEIESSRLCEQCQMYEDEDDPDGVWEEQQNWRYGQ